jgi:G patch domain-containing protein 1
MCVYMFDCCDTTGRRRFHGAFTGGFSAGYYNTVGSAEGWAPKQFVSSRKKRAAEVDEMAGAVRQKPSDFMDAEDLEQFGLVEGLVARDGFDILVCFFILYVICLCHMYIYVCVL